MSRVIDHLRAAFIIFHVVAVVVLAIPAPGRVKRHKLEKGEARAQIETAVRVARSLGIQTNRRALTDRIWNGRRALIQWRSGVLRPFRPYAVRFGVHQSWRMFAFIVTEPAELRVEVDRGDGWEIVYDWRSREHRWNGTVFEHARMRGVLNGASFKGSQLGWGKLARWTGRRALEDHPDAVAARVSLLRFRIPGPRKARRGVRPDKHQTSAFVLRRDEL